MKTNQRSKSFHLKKKNFAVIVKSLYTNNTLVRKNNNKIKRNYKQS